MNSIEFIPGIQLCRRFYWEAVRPMLDRHFTSLPHAAALIGYGSEVLGFDTPMSMDHNWHPRVLLFMDEPTPGLADFIHEMLRQNLSHTFLGFPVDAVETPSEPGTYWMGAKSEGPVEHRVRITTLSEFITEILAWDYRSSPTPADWLSFSSQALLEVTAGEVFYDPSGELTRLRASLAWYPQDVWFYLMAAGWDRIGEEEHLMPRAGYVGDELGSSIIGSRLVRDVMNMAFLMEKRYAPYPKWFGSSFQRLDCAAALSPLLWQAQQAGSWQERSKALCAAYAVLGEMHNRLQITQEIPIKIDDFYNRPFPVIDTGSFSQALLERVEDTQVRQIASLGMVGNLNQISDNTTFLSDSSWRKAIRLLYDRESGCD